MIKLFRVSIPTSVLVLILLEFLVSCACMLLGAFVFLSDELDVFLLYDGGWIRLALVPVSLLFTFYFQDLYSDFRGSLSKTVLLQHCIVAIGVALLIQSLIAYLLPSWIAPRAVLLFGTALFC